jgi:hypothetical protein
VPPNRSESGNANSRHFYVKQFEYLIVDFKSFTSGGLRTPVGAILQAFATLFPIFLANDVGGSKPSAHHAAYPLVWLDSLFTAAPRNQQLEDLLIPAGNFDLLQINHGWPRQRGLKFAACGAVKEKARVSPKFRHTAQ